MPRSRDYRRACPSRPKHQRYDSYDSDSDSSDSDDSDDTSSTEEEEGYFHHKLDPVVFTPEEEEEFWHRYMPSPLLYTDDSDKDGPKAQCTETDPVHFMRSTTKAPEPNPGEPKPFYYSHQKMMEYLTMTGKEQAELFATSLWDTKVYDLFNVRRCIVHPDYFLASENCPHHTVSTILGKLDKMKHSTLSGFYSWRYVKKRLKYFLDIFEGLENLADVFHLDYTAKSLKNQFLHNVTAALMANKNPCNNGSYKVLRGFAERLVHNEGSHKESTFKQFIEALFNQLNNVTNNSFPFRSMELELVLPAQKSRPVKKVEVKPDIMVLGGHPEIMLVGEVKPFGHKGVKYTEQRGRKVRRIQPDVSNVRLMRQTEPDTGQPQGQGDQLPPTANEKDKSVPSSTTDEPRASTSKDTGQPQGQGDQLHLTVDEKEKSVSSLTTDEACASTSRDTGQPRGKGDQLPLTVDEKEKSVLSLTTDEPHASTSREQTESSTESENSTIPSRPLDEKEEHKVDKYLPQLFGQMLAAMHENETAKNSSAYQFCEMYENVQFGFVVEGFKLRFVKLTIIDLMKKQGPSVRGLLSGERVKCYVSMTQEFNLFNKHHLEMFYQMLLAMHYLCL